MRYLIEWRVEGSGEHGTTMSEARNVNRLLALFKKHLESRHRFVNLELSDLEIQGEVVITHVNI
jgi:hypothetical protein